MATVHTGLFCMVNKKRNEFDLTDSPEMRGAPVDVRESGRDASLETYNFLTRKEQLDSFLFIDCQTGTMTFW
jgi:hypothetical protein